MSTPVDKLVEHICEQARYKALNDHDLQQLCYNMFLQAFPPRPAPNPGMGMHYLNPGANERPGEQPPERWELFMDGVGISYDHTTKLPWAIAGLLTGKVRERLRREPFRLTASSK